MTVFLGFAGVDEEVGLKWFVDDVDANAFDNADDDDSTLLLFGGVTLSSREEVGSGGHFGSEGASGNKGCQVVEEEEEVLVEDLFR